MCVRLHAYIHPSISQSLCLSGCLSLPACLPACLSGCLFVYLSIYLSPQTMLLVYGNHKMPGSLSLRAASTLLSGLGVSFPSAEADGPSHNAGRPEQMFLSRIALLLSAHLDSGCQESTAPLLQIATYFKSKSGNSFAICRIMFVSCGCLALNL